MTVHLDYPTFMVIGAQKCGTSWLAKMMAQHPQIAVAKRKEVHFFDYARNYQKGLAWYRDQFELNDKTKAVGEFTPGYFGTNYEDIDIVEHQLMRDIPKLINDACPDAKFILSLRDPVDRAISAYYHHIRRGRFAANRSILDVVRNQAIYNRGCYHIHLKNWLKYYPLDRFLIFIYEEDLNDKRKITALRRAYEYVGVDPDYRPVDLYERFNAEGSHFDMRTIKLPKLLGKGLRTCVPKVVKRMPIWHIDVSEEEQAVLRESYQNHNRELEDMLCRKLPW